MEYDIPHERECLLTLAGGNMLCSYGCSLFILHEDTRSAQAINCNLTIVRPLFGHVAWQFNFLWSSTRLLSQTCHYKKCAGESHRPRRSKSSETRWRRYIQIESKHAFDNSMWIHWDLGIIYITFYKPVYGRDQQLDQQDKVFIPLLAWKIRTEGWQMRRYAKQKLARGYP